MRTGVAPTQRDRTSQLREAVRRSLQSSGGRPPRPSSKTSPAVAGGGAPRGVAPVRPATLTTLPQGAALAIAPTNPAHDPPAEFAKLRGVSDARSGPKLSEMDAVISLAERAPSLADVSDELEVVKKQFVWLARLYRDWSPDTYYFFFVEAWDHFRSLVVQRASGFFSAELRAADRIASDVFRRFYLSPLLTAANRAYAADARPVVLVGPSGPDSYYTYPPQLERPLGIINLPEGSVRCAWRWLALPHEVGHDIYASVPGLPKELEQALADALGAASAAGKYTLAPVAYDDGAAHLTCSGAEFAALLWTQWANESQADVVGLLNCGGAALITLQQIVGFDVTHSMQTNWAAPDPKLLVPEPHPTSYLRNVLNLRALRRLGFTDFADALQRRFEANRPPGATEISFETASGSVVCKQPISELEKTIDVALDVLLDRPLQSLNGHSYRGIVTFTPADQAIVERVAEAMLIGEAHFDRGASPRHSLAAIVLALESAPQQADALHESFIYLLGPPPR